MNRLTVILLAALDAVIALGVGVAIPLVPLTVLWATKLDLAAGWAPFWRAAADIWLLGHGTDVTITLAPAASALFGLSGTNVFPITIAALGFALLTVLLGSRTGRRAWATPHAFTAAIAGVVVFAVLSALVTLSAHTGSAIPSLLQGTLLPPAVFAIGIGLGMIAAELRDRNDPAHAEHPASDSGPALPWPIVNWSPSTRAVLASGLRAGAAATLLLIAAAAVVLGVLMAVRYGRIVGLYETLQPGVLGAGALTLAQLALLPNAVIWTASWLVGPGFAVGTGSSVDVTQTALGPLPSVPILGALPQGDPGFGLVAVLVPVLCGAAVGFLARQRLERMPAPRTLRSVASPSWGVGRLALVVLCAAVTSGAIIGLLAWWSSGSIGPGRLQHAGPNALLIAGFAAVEVLVGGAIGIAVRRQPDEAAAPPTLRERRAAASDVVSSGRGAAPNPTAWWAGAASSSGTSVDDVEADTAPVTLVGADAASGKPHSSGDSIRSVLDWYGPDAMGSDDHDDEPAPRPRARGAATAQDPPPKRNAPAPRGSASSLSRPSAPRVPTPGRMPRAYREQDFAKPEFARHEDDEADAGPQGSGGRASTRGRGGEGSGR
ncbi:hypothetical protein HII28_07770 [Planctomonas sp. JC2975]|uniref:cell division protein PerM n=1 Tax=Planctomonas sp. JC2975 TaxID=2729626 RepID=UPI001473EC88|nr:DUF6350 family protein [Planctomonas sp. JC2975]NNC11772.1 hypothetical protein [Planctomonas sp. JC2975]